MKDKFVFNSRIIRSPSSDYYGDEIEDSFQAYPDRYLREIADEGYNGIWLRVILREIVSSTPFPEFGNKRKEQLAALNKLVAKASRFGIKVYLYFCEPRGFKAKDPFWQRHPEVKGQPVTFQATGGADGLYFALCSSTAAVREYLEESSFNLFKCVPGLGGVFLITASEHHTHCYSHFPKPQKERSDPNIDAWLKTKFSCPRCRNRQPTEVVAEIIRLINRGVKSAAPDAAVIAWTWSWSILEPDPQRELIALLPKDIILMSDWERGGQKKVCGKRYPLDEYSFSYPGPSPKFKKQLEIAKKRGMRTMAKIQIGTTHELASVPYLPLPHLLAIKMQRLKEFRVDGYIGCWIFGGGISPMSKLAGKMSQLPGVSPAKAIKELAQTEFGKKSAASVRRAWRCFATAWRKYPFSIPFLYYGPINYATAYPLSLNLKKRPPTASWRPLPRDKKGHLLSGDNLEVWVKPFGAQTIIKAFRELLKVWEMGVAILSETLEKNEQNQRLKEELNLAKHIALSARSTINIIRFYPLFRKLAQLRCEPCRGRIHPTRGLDKSSPYRGNFYVFKLPKERGKRLHLQIKKIFKAEMEIVIEDKKLLKFDKRLGYHPEAHTYLFTQKDLDYKISLLRSCVKKM